MPDDQPAVPDVDRLARSMLLLHGDHHDHNDSPEQHRTCGSWSKSRDFADEALRLVLTDDTAGLLAVRSKTFDVGALGAVAAAMVYLALTIDPLGTG